MGGREYVTAGEVVGPWLQKMEQGRMSMEQEGAEAAVLPGMEGGGAPIPEENTSRVMGRLTRRAFVTEVAGGHKKALFTLLVPRSYRDGEGRIRKRNSLVAVTAWRAQAAQVEPLGKGSAVLVEGYLESWSDEEGRKFRLDVVAEQLKVLDRRDLSTEMGPAPARAKEESAPAA